MKIEVLGPLYPINQFAMKAFAEILNTILIADNVIELNNRLYQRDQQRSEDVRSLNGYFKWNFDNRSFLLWQRTSYMSHTCFPQMLLKINYSEIACNVNSINIKN